MKEDLAEALFDISEKYGADVTNNFTGIRNGVYLQHVGDFIKDIEDAFIDAGWTPPDA